MQNDIVEVSMRETFKTLRKKAKDMADRALKKAKDMADRVGKKAKDEGGSNKASNIKLRF